MKEFPLLVPLKTGLRNHAERIPGPEGLVRCLNLSPRFGKLVGYTPVKDMLLDTGYYQRPRMHDWPYPVVFFGAEKIYAITRRRVYELTHNFIPITHYDVAPADYWSFVDFGPYTLLSNGVELLRTNPTSGQLQRVFKQDLPPMSTMCNYSGMLVCGGVQGFPPDWVVWGKIGEASIKLDHYGTAGRRPLLELGPIQRVMPIGLAVAVYGSKGVGMLKLEPDAGAMSFRMIADVGIRGPWAVDGDQRKQIYVGEDGKLRMVTSEYLSHFLDYGEWVGSMVTPVVCYEPSMEEWYIGDGEKSFVYGSGVMYECHQSISSLHLVDGELYGTFTDTEDYRAMLTTGTFDMGLAGRKSVEGVEVSGTGRWRVQSHFYYPQVGGFRSGALVQTNPDGYARSKVTGSDLRISVVSPTYHGVDLDYLTVRWKLPDKRFVRGVYAGKVNDESDS